MLESAPAVAEADRLTAATIRGLAMDGVQAANSGHPGMPFGMADVVIVLWTRFLRYDPTDPAWKNDPGLKAWAAFMDKYYPGGDRTSTFTTYGYSAAQAMEVVLRQCGDELTRANVMKQAASLKDVQLEMFLPGIRLNTSATDYFPIEQMQLVRFTGEGWERMGDIIDGAIRN